MRTLDKYSRKGQIEVDANLSLPMNPKRLIVVLGTLVFARGVQAEVDQWTVSVWVQDKDRELGEGEPDLVFPTLMRNFDQAFALVAISVRDHLRSVQTGRPVLPTGMFDPECDQLRTPGRYSERGRTSDRIQSVMLGGLQSKAGGHEDGLSMLVNN